MLDLRFLAAPIAALVLLCACGSSNEPTPLNDLHTTNSYDAGAPRPPFDYRDGLTTDPATTAACERYANAELAYESTCTIAIHPDKRAYYIDRYKLACQVAASEPNVNFVPATIDECSQALAAWQAARCENRPPLASLRNPLDVCKSFLHGTAKPGDSCTVDAECASGQCLTDSTLVAGVAADLAAKLYTTCGRCGDIVADGQSCTNNFSDPEATVVVTPAVCAAGSGCPYGCEISDGGSECPPPVCTAGAAEGGDCNLDYACAVGLECRYLSIPDKLECVAPKAIGAACAEQNECADSTICRDGACAAQSLAGEACRIDGATIPFDTWCIGSLECTSPLTCEPPAFGALQPPGAPCGRSLVQVDDCQYGASLCVASDKLVCPGQLEPESAACDSALDCDGTSLCIDGTCQPLTTGACVAHAWVH